MVFVGNLGFVLRKKAESWKTDQWKPKAEKWQDNSWSGPSLRVIYEARAFRVGSLLHILLLSSGLVFPANWVHLKGLKSVSSFEWLLGR